MAVRRGYVDLRWLRARQEMLTALRTMVPMTSYAHRVPSKGTERMCGFVKKTGTFGEFESSAVNHPLLHDRIAKTDAERAAIKMARNKGQNSTMTVVVSSTATPDNYKDLLGAVFPSLDAFQVIHITD